MNRSPQHHARLRAVALIGTYVPRQCGIATFTADLSEALAAESPELEVWALAINDAPEGYRYPDRVRFEINYKDPADYRLAAEFLNMNQIDAVCLQHEYGIFGGPDGSHILELLRGLRMPVVTTLHTVLKQPSPAQKAVLEEIARISDRLVVMSHKAKELLTEVYRVHPDRITLIWHGIPDVPFVDPNFYKDQFGVEGRKVILTFGLLSPGKGLEYMLNAMPEVVRKHPEATYIILGATHPHVKQVHGEAYRLSLQRRARDLGVQDHIIFHNRFVDLSELCEFLGAADIYVTPYLNREQIVSGTLAYALGAGKATVSTPYWFAEEMLQEGRGRLAPFRDAGQLAAHVIDLLDNEVERHAMRKRAYNFCRGMVWKEVARGYLQVFTEVREQRDRQPRGVFKTKTLHDKPYEIPQLKLDHLQRLTDDVGILQHAKFIVPDRSHGYCTDDNARALVAALLAADWLPDAGGLTDLACRYLSFLNHAYNDANGRFRNFMGYDRRWLEEVGSDDCQGRAIWGLGVAVAWSQTESLTGAALHLFDRALPMLLELNSPRAWALGLVGIHAYLRRFSGDSAARRAREKLAERLFQLHARNASPDWPWLEDSVHYDNGKLSQALIMSGQWLQRGDMIEAGLRSLEWLLKIQSHPGGHFAPVGNRGWYVRGGEKARFDQQPLEAQSLIEACVEAYHVTADEIWVERARWLLEWFLGRNDHNKPLYDYQSGGCCDGLSADGVNLNQGAESTLAWLLSVINVNMLVGAQAASVRLGATPAKLEETAAV